MRMIPPRSGLFLLFLSTLGLCSCATTSSHYSAYQTAEEKHTSMPADYADRLPQHIASNAKTVVVNPREHVWGAYEDGRLIRAGLATSGANWCPDIHKPCHTRPGTFRVYSMGNEDCKSSKFPLPRGGAPMPYCMFFDGGRAIHGVPEGEVAEANLSHGCVRLHTEDAEWLRYDFVNIGTRVVIEPY